MKVKIDVKSVEIVTPSSPTPGHLTNYKLSILDQIMSDVLMPLVLFYPTNEKVVSNSEISNHLKKSLSKVLTLFYPLAGRLVGNSYVNCNDEGVRYVEAGANCKLFDVITDPSLEELIKFVPCDSNDARNLCLVQATFFSCGGIAIGLAISHKLVDALSYSMFVDSWAAISRGNELIQSPIFESATLFPPRDSIAPRDSSIGSLLKKEKKENFVTKRFRFSAAKISMLRDKYTKNTNEGLIIRPTRIETLTAFIWTRFMVATGAKNSNTDSETKKVYALLLYVDIRKRVVPPLTENHFGNIIMRTYVVASFKNYEESTYGLVKKIRDAIRDVDPDSLAKISERDESLEALKIKGRVKLEFEGKLDVIRFSSVCRLPMYEPDFGWGKPKLGSSDRIITCKMVYFMDSISGDGIDAMVNLNVEEMVKFEADEELNQYIVC